MSILDRYYQMRNRVLADVRFQRWAAGFWLTRPIASRRSRALFDLCAGFVYSQVLAACFRLRVFDILAEGPLRSEVLAERMGLPQAAAERLLKAAVALDLLMGRGPDRYALGTLGAAALANPAIGAMVQHHALLYADLGDPVALLKRGGDDTRLSAYWPYATAAEPTMLPAHRVAAYTTLMSQSQALVAGDLIDAYPFGRHRCLLDVGGGDGTFLSALAPRAKRLDLILYDLPPVADIARSNLAAGGLGNRAKVCSGDFRTDALPDGADVVTLVRVLHDHDADAALEILRNVHRALGPGGTLVLAEPMAGTRGAEPVGDAYFGFYLLAMGAGSPRTAQQNSDLMRAAGFNRIRRVRTRRPGLIGALAATA